MNLTQSIINFDYLSITFDIPIPNRETTLNKLLELSKRDKSDSRYKIECTYERIKKSRYKKNFLIFIRPTSKNPISNSASYHGVKFILSLDPIDKTQILRGNRKKQYYAKIAFNPNKTKFPGAQKISNFLCRLINEEVVGKLYENGRITRLDMCVDLHEQSLVFLPYAPKVKKYKSYKTKAGAVSSIILGSAKSKSKIRIYDKKKEEREKGKRPSTYDIHLRLELQQRDLRCTPEFCSVMPFKKKLTQVDFFNQTLFEDDSIDSTFKSNVVEGGINYALNFLDKKKRRAILVILREKHLLPQPFDVHGIRVEQFSLLLSAFKKIISF